MKSVNFWIIGFIASTTAQVDLGTASSFKVISGQTITNTGPTVIDGDIGTAGSAIVGFPPGIVTGSAFISGTVFQPIEDAYTAFNNISSRTGTVLTRDLGGMSLAPGTYKFSSSATLNGILTLSGNGSSRDAWYFQIGSSLSTASGSSVVRTGGGLPCNVWWQVGSSATLGVGSAFAGTIIAGISITLNTAASTNGGVFGLAGSVTLDTNLLEQSCLQGSSLSTTASSLISTSSSFYTSEAPGTSILDISTTVMTFDSTASDIVSFSFTSAGFSNSDSEILTTSIMDISTTVMTFDSTASETASFIFTGSSGSYLEVSATSLVDTSTPFTSTMPTSPSSELASSYQISNSLEITIPQTPSETQIHTSSSSIPLLSFLQTTIDSSSTTDTPLGSTSTDNHFETNLDTYAQLATSSPASLDTIQTTAAPTADITSIPVDMTTPTTSTKEMGPEVITRIVTKFDTIFCIGASMISKPTPTAIVRCTKMYKCFQDSASPSMNDIPGATISPSYPITEESYPAIAESYPTTAESKQHEAPNGKENTDEASTEAKSSTTSTTLEPASSAPKNTTTRKTTELILLLLSVLAVLL